MIQLHQFVFNDFLENAYVLYDETGECVIVDPGCYYASEKEDLRKFIQGNNLRPVLLLNTHCHVDHVFGNKFISETFAVPLLMNEGDIFLLDAAVDTGKFYGISMEPSPPPDKFLSDGDEVHFGNSMLKVIAAPGHSPGGICFYAVEEKMLVSGDVLFQSSIGRTDLPGGNYQILMESIFNKVLPLPGETKVYSGHGPVTTIGDERKNNPFLIEYAETMKVK